REARARSGARERGPPGHRGGRPTGHRGSGSHGGGPRGGRRGPDLHRGDGLAVLERAATGGGPALGRGHPDVLAVDGESGRGIVVEIVVRGGCAAAGSGREGRRL